MYKIGKYKSSDRLFELICDNYPMLLAISRLGIPLGFGDKTIAEVCEDNDVDVNTFLSIVNLLIADEDERDQLNFEFDKLSIDAIIRYLRNSHSYFLDFKLPNIRIKLLEAIDYGSLDLSLVIMRYYDEYVAEVRKHMMYEENTVFPYIDEMMKGAVRSEYNIDVFSKKHDKVELKLSELKNIIIKYYPGASSNELNNALFDIFSCAADLASHNQVEDYLLVPLIREWESKTQST